MAKVALICAGGTGGHLFPAEALARELKARGWTVHLATDHRVDAYAKDFPAEAVHIVPSATFTRNPVAVIKAAFTLARGYFAAQALVRRIKPNAAIGFGGYPTVPPMLAAVRMQVPTIIHDANAILGRANTFLASRVTAIATAFPEVKKAGKFAGKAVETGNPVRQKVRDAADTPYPEREPDDPFKLLVFGGSQGARFLSDVLPAAVAALTADRRSCLRVVQQCRPEDMDRVKVVYREARVQADLSPFFDDMPARIAASHLVVSRSGASTVAELAVIGRPAVMIPLPHALDQDQKENAQILAEAGGGWMIEQADLSANRLAALLTELIDSPEDLASAAEAAKEVGRPDAVANLANLVERIADGKPLVDAPPVEDDEPGEADEPAEDGDPVDDGDEAPEGSDEPAGDDNKEAGETDKPTGDDGTDTETDDKPADEDEEPARKDNPE